MAKAMFYDLLKAEFADTASFVNVGRHTIKAVGALIKGEEDKSAGATESPLLVLFRGQNPTTHPRFPPHSLPLRARQTI